MDTDGKSTRVPALLSAFIFLLGAASAAIVAVILSPFSWAPGTSGDLIGEVLVNSRADAFLHANKGVEEAAKLWSEPASNWQVMHSDASLVVEARQITEGPFADSGVFLTRAESTLDVSILGVNMTADDVFSFLTSPEGFAVIDPASDPEEFSGYVERYRGWRKGAKLEVAEAYLRLPPPMLERDFVVLNAIDHKSRVFVSKSVLHRDRPGASVYYAGDSEVASAPSHDGVKRVRALNTFAVRVDELRSHEVEGEPRLSLKMINFFDGVLIHSSVANWISCKGFFPGVFDRLKEALSEN